MQAQRHVTRHRLLNGLVSLILGLCSTALSASERVALVIGNNAYASAPLDNPVRDAKAISAALRKLGFEVIELNDAGKSQIEMAIGEFRDLLKASKGVGMVYYAGHAIQLNWRNYLVPVDARLGRAQDVGTQTVDVQLVLDAFKQAGNRMNIVVLDACRDNPFGATGRSGGLAPLDAPLGTFLAYSTAPGNLAEDGTAEQGNSIYTHYLVQELGRPDSRIEDVFKRVRLQVRQRTEGRQIPWESTSLEDEFLFDKGVQAPAKHDARSRELEFNAEKADWDRISASKDPKDFYAHLEKYPSGLISEWAISRLNTLQSAKVREQAGPDGRLIGNWLRGVRDGDRYDVVFKDGLTGLETRRGSVVVRVDGNELRYVGVGNGIASSRFTTSGFQIEDRGGTYDPPYPVIPGGELQVGKKYRSRSIRTGHDGRKSWIDYDVHIVGRESLTVPAGTFDTYKVVVNQLHESGTHVAFTLWFEPGWSMALKFVHASRDSRGRPDVLVREVVRRARAP